MPKEPPRHEFTKVKAGKEILGHTINYDTLSYVKEYDPVEKSVEKREKKSGRDTKNPSKRTARTATQVVAEALKSVTDADNNLKKLLAGSGVEFTGFQGEDLRVQARASSTDLAGYFNDYKISLENGVEQAPNRDRLLDWLELAEQKGGIGDWLRQWNALMRDPSQRTDYSRMADIADSIRAGIEFQTALIREMDLFKDSSASSPDAPENPFEAPVEAPSVLSLLNSIGFEISRQLGEALANRFETGSQLRAARNSLKQMNSRESHAEKLRQAVKNLSVADLASLLIEGGKGSTSSIHNTVDSLVQDLQPWEDAATKMSALVQTIGTPDYPGDMMEKSIAKSLMEEQIKAMNSIGNTAKTVFDLAADLSRGTEISVFVKEKLLFSFAQIASGILEQQRSFAAQLKDPQTKQKLIDQAELARNICTMIEKKRQDPHLPRFYEQAVAASQAGTLRELWSTTRTKILTELKQAGGQEAAAELENVFKDNLGEKLDDWGKRRKNPQDIYGLTWQLVATLRRYQTQALGILGDMASKASDERDDPKKRIANFLNESMNSILDAISGAVAQELDEDMKAGRG